MEVRPAGESDVDACVGVLAALADHFTPDTHDDLRSRWGSSRTWVAVDGDEVVGFVSLEQRYPNGAEIPYAGVLPDRQRHGTGRLFVPGPRRGRRPGDRGEDARRLRRLRALRRHAGVLGGDGVRAGRQHRPAARLAAGNPSAIYVCAVRAT